MNTPTTYVALLRAVNVGGTGKLSMADLREICTGLGFGDVRTYIASGNVVFTSALTEPEIVALLTIRLDEHMGGHVGVMVRSGAQMRAVLDANPFPDQPANRVVAIFLPGPPPTDTLESVRRRHDEQVALGEREIYIHYPEGMGASKLKVPAASTGTARNLNTVAKLVEML